MMCHEFSSDLHLGSTLKYAYVTQADGLHHRYVIDTVAWVRDLIITYMREEAHTVRVPITFKHKEYLFTS